MAATTPTAAAGQAIEEVETDLLLDAVYRLRGFDFRDYASNFLKRRIWNRVHEEGLQDVAELQARLLQDSDCMERFLRTVTVNVTV